MVFRTRGGDKRDRTADLLNAIDGRGSVRQGQALQKEKPLKYKGFLPISPFRTLYFSASCALELRDMCPAPKCVVCYLLNV